MFLVAEWSYNGHTAPGPQRLDTVQTAPFQPGLIAYVRPSTRCSAREPILVARIADMTCENAYRASRGRQSTRPRWRELILERAGAVGLGCLLGLGKIADANAYNHGHSADHPSPIVAQGSSDGMTGMSAKGMMRADMAPPLGIMGGMSPRQGVFMPSLQFMHMRMDGNRDGTNDVSTTEVLARFPVAPINMDVDMLMPGVMYGISDDIAVMAMIPYLWKSMDHVTRMGTEFTTGSEGFGDLRVVGGYDIYKTEQHTLKLTAGLSVPTGSTDERDDTPAGPDQLLPYAMQTDRELLICFPV